MIIRQNRRRFLRMGVAGGVGLVVAQFGWPKKAFASGSYNGQVSASTDDAKGGTVDGLTSAQATFRNGAFGFRFTDVTVPQGATIGSAYMWVYNYDPDHTDAEMTVSCDKQANSPTFSSTDYPDLRTGTDANADWGADSNQSAPSWYQSPDISAPIQEVINMSGWTSGNALSILWGYDGSGGGGLAIRMWDYGDHTLAAKLQINY